MVAPSSVDNGIHITICIIYERTAWLAQSMVCKCVHYGEAALHFFARERECLPSCCSAIKAARPWGGDPSPCFNGVSLCVCVLRPERCTLAEVCVSAVPAQLTVLAAAIRTVVPARLKEGKTGVGTGGTRKRSSEVKT